MSDFLKFIDDLRHSFAIHIEIYYSKNMDWCITIYKKGCSSDYIGADIEGDDVIICKIQDCDMELCFAKAHVVVKEWMREFNGGY